MKRICYLVFALTLLPIITTTVRADQYPKATGYVSDFANLLTREQGLSLNNELVAFEKRTTIEIAVVTVTKLDGQSIEDYTRRLAGEWGVGKRTQNNGIVFLVAPKERQMRIEIASGIRSTLTSGQADQIRDRIVLPHFKAGNMAQGIIDGTHGIIRALDVGLRAIEIKKQASQVVQSTDDTESAIVRKTFYYGLGIIAVVIAIAGLILFAVVASERRTEERENLLKTLSRINSQFSAVRDLAESYGAARDTIGRIPVLHTVFQDLERRITSNKNIDWLDLSNRLGLVEDELGIIAEKLRKENHSATEARSKGSRLIQKIPELLTEAETRLTQSQSSKDDLQRLRKAREEYGRAQTQVTSPYRTVDWVALYAILTGVESEVTSLGSTGGRAGEDEPVHPSSRTRPTDHSLPTNEPVRPSLRTRSTDRSSSATEPPDQSSSYGFGASSGFDGGGGFGSGDSGSSGSW